MLNYEERAKKIQLVIFDVDGVFTDGKLMIGASGELYKPFNSLDGFGVTLLRLSGLKTAIITGRKSEIVAFRVAELKIDDVYQNEKNKLKALRALADKYQLALTQIAYVGDDLMDMPVMKHVGLACAVANARPEVKSLAHYTTVNCGGNGAVREIAELLLKAQGKWAAIVAAYLNEQPLEESVQ